MGFATALSGLAAASTNLQVIGNNIANANTTGFKESRAEFADVYNSQGPAVPGAGVRVTEVAQQFNDGNVESTQNNLDLALSKNGFFALGNRSDSTNATAFTRNGAFHLSPEGFITNDSGLFLMGGSPVGTSVEDGFNLGAPQAIQIDTSQGVPSATTSVDLKVNLDARDGMPSKAFTGYDPAVSAGPDVDSYNNSTSATIFDSLGNTHTLTTYFVDETPDGAATSTWGAYTYLDGRAITTGFPATLDNPDPAVSASLLGITSSDANTATGVALIADGNALQTSIANLDTALSALDSALNALPVAPSAAEITNVNNLAVTSGSLANEILILANTADTNATAAIALYPLTAAEAASAEVAVINAEGFISTIIAQLALNTPAGYAAAAAASGSAVTQVATATTETTDMLADANTETIAAELIAVPLAAGVSQQQIDAANAAATLPGATVSSVLLAASTAELVGTKIPMTFDSLGNLVADTTGTNSTGANADDNFVFSNIDIAPLLALNVSASPLTFSINPTGSTQFASDFGVNDLQQDGFASGNLTGVSVDKEGVVLARYSNGTSKPLGQVILGRFTNNQGLSKIGDSTWQESTSSGSVVLGVAGGNNFGDITSSALEGSNTDIATQLVKMIVAQQAYQANAQTISTEDEIIQRILQL
ncbi:MAG: flagellar hook-basal body complex protein [Methylomarinum sp.]|nr:flagellar hook-basal body complex protein [Methylomarinum sp.]